jgi:arsenate reductase
MKMSVSTGGFRMAPFFRWMSGSLIRPPANFSYRREDEPRNDQETADDDQPGHCQRHDRADAVMIKYVFSHMRNRRSRPALRYRPPACTQPAIEKGRWPMPVTIYGFKGCDTVRKARAWLDAHGVAHDFFDYRLKSLDPAVVDHWFQSAGWETVLNRNSTTFRELPEPAKTGIDEQKARAMMLAETNLIKRPVLDAGGKITTGFRPAVWEQLLPTIRRGELLD